MLYTIKNIIIRRHCQLQYLWITMIGFPSKTQIICRNAIRFNDTPTIGMLPFHSYSGLTVNINGFDNNNLTETNSTAALLIWLLAFFMLGILYFFFVSENNLKDKGHSQQPLLQLFFSLGKEK